MEFNVLNRIADYLAVEFPDFMCTVTRVDEYVSRVVVRHEDWKPDAPQCDFYFEMRNNDVSQGGINVVRLHTKRSDGVDENEMEKYVYYPGFRNAVPRNMDKSCITEVSAPLSEDELVRYICKFIHKYLIPLTPVHGLK